MKLSTPKWMLQRSLLQSVLCASNMLIGDHPWQHEQATTESKTFQNHNDLATFAFRKIASGCSHLCVPKLMAKEMGQRKRNWEMTKVFVNVCSNKEHRMICRLRHQQMKMNYGNWNLLFCSTARHTKGQKNCVIVSNIQRPLIPKSKQQCKRWQVFVVDFLCFHRDESSNDGPPKNIWDLSVAGASVLMMNLVWTHAHFLCFKFQKAACALAPCWVRLCGTQIPGRCLPLVHPGPAATHHRSTQRNTRRK